MIVQGFLRAVGHLITYNAPITDIRLDDDGVTVAYQDGSSISEASADFCVSNIPCSVLKDIPNNFDGALEEAVDSVKFAPSCKVGWQCNTRFWENDRNRIYGGISWTDNLIEQVWYPSNDFFSQTGTLTGAYIHGREAAEFGRYGLEERLRKAKQGGGKFHDEFKDESIVPTDLGLSIAWQNIPYQKGAWAHWSGNDEVEHKHYERLLNPDRRFYIVGDQVSQLPGWQEGAMMSAEHVSELITETKQAASSETIRAPETFKVIRGQR